MRTFVYLHEPDLGQIRSRDWKLGDLIAINNEEFLTVEHAERNGWNSKNIYKFSIAGATPVTSNDFGWQHFGTIDAGWFGCKRHRSSSKRVLYRLA
jgi:hypothetical protein